MRPGPSKSGNAASSFVEKTTDAWEGCPPDWIIELARISDNDGLKGAGIKVGYSPSAISSVLSATYRGDLVRVEGAVRWSLMSATVDCPMLGELRRDRCLEWQRKPFAATSSHRVAMYRACRGGCPHARFKPSES